MTPAEAILLEQRRAADQWRKETESKRHPSGLYAAGSGWFTRKLELEHSPCGWSKATLISPEQVCERYRRQYGKALTVEQLKKWSNAGNFPLPRSINGVIGWEQNVVTRGLSDLSRIGGRGFTCITRAGGSL